MSICVYTVNENSFYMQMAANSISMLRRYSKIPIRLYFIEDEGTTTTLRDGQKRLEFSKPQMLNFCEKHGVEVIFKPPVGDYFYLNRKYIAECDEQTVLHMDGDTFIYGDVGALIEKYKDFDFVASGSLWMESQGFDSVRFLGTPGTPFNSGIMIFNNGWARKWAAALPDICEDLLATNRRPASEWVQAQSNSREEIGTNVFVRENGLRTAYLTDQECHILVNVDDLDRSARDKSSMIVHTYSDHWYEFYKISTSTRPRLLGKLVR